MPKIRYEVDPHNRLVIKETGKDARISRFRTVLDGRFKIDKNNSLIYHAKIPSRGNKLQQIRLNGRWKLDKNHNLIFSLNKWGNQIAGNKLILKGALLSLKARKVEFSITTKEKNGKRIIYILKLGGSWKIDKYNRLNFDVRKERNTDKLVFQGEWRLKNNRIVYSHRNLILFGYWDIKEKYRLRYRLGKGLDSGFDFRTSLGIPVKRGGYQGLKYELGVGFSRRSKYRKGIIIFGKWRIKNGVGLIFEVEYEKGIKRSLNFTSTVRLNKDHTLTLQLKNIGNRDLGIRLQLSQRLLKAGQGFLRLLASKQEKAVEIGAGFRW